MANTYVIDKHPDKSKIVADLLSGKTPYYISKNYDHVTISAADRYKRDVLFPVAVQKKGKEIELAVEDLLKKLERQIMDLDQLAFDCKKSLYRSGKLFLNKETSEYVRTALLVAKELRESTKDLIAIKKGTVPVSAEVNVNFNSNEVYFSQIANVFAGVEDEELRNKLVLDLKEAAVMEGIDESEVQH